jgi:hypothetical protein
MRLQFRGKARMLAGGILLAVCGGAAAEGFRNIASVTFDAYFDHSWRLETTDVFLARIVPALTAVAKLSRVDSEGRNQHLFFLGPVVSFTDTLYLETVYGLGIDSDDSDGRFSHELDVNFNFETDATAAAVGLKADWFPASGYSYYIPSISGKLHPRPALGLFGKFFLSIDSNAKRTESFWGQADYRFSPLVGTRAGFTASLSQEKTFGYSLLAGIDLFFRRALTLKYTFQYLSDTIEPLTALQPRSGISNALILDARF